jgi:chromosome segregation ATPase
MNRRWKALAKLDAEIDDLTAKQTAARARLEEAEQALQRAPDKDAKTLAAWLAAGEKGKRPQATVYEREGERDAARLLVEAVQLEIYQALERRLRHVERHRRKMLEDARRDVEEARRTLLAKVAELPALRDELLGARETLL